MAEQEGKKPADEVMELKIKCGNYAQKCVDLMAEMQKKEADWKDRESVMVRRMEEAMKLIKNFKVRVDELEAEKQTGESTDILQMKVKVAALEKIKKSFELDLKSAKAELEIKTVLESKKSRLVDLLDIKLQEKAKLTDLLKLKCSHQDAKVALADARMAQLERDKCEMALYLETMRQHMKKSGLDVFDPYEVKKAKERELKKKLEDGIKTIDKAKEEALKESGKGQQSDDVKVEKEEKGDAQTEETKDPVQDSTAQGASEQATTEESKQQAKDTGTTNQNAAEPDIAQPVLQPEVSDAKDALPDGNVTSQNDTAEQVTSNQSGGDSGAVHSNNVSQEAVPSQPETSS